MKSGGYTLLVLEPISDSETDDVSLARRIAEAAPEIDSAAESALTRRLAPRVRLYGLKHLRDEQAADDLAQRVILETLQSLRAGRLRNPERLISFVLGTCRQMVIDQRRTQQRRTRILDTFRADLPVGSDESGLRVFETAGAAESDRRLGSLEPRLQPCLEALPERERSVLLLTFYAERPAKEIAEQFAISEGNVRVIRHRGLTRLRDCISREARTI